MFLAYSAPFVFSGMAAKGSFSYNNTTINCFNIGNGLQIRVEAINDDVASMVVTDIQGNQQPIPPTVTLLNSANNVVLPWNNAFLLTWFGSYTMRANGEEKIWMINQKQQAFRTTNDVTHSTV